MLSAAYTPPLRQAQAYPTTFLECLFEKLYPFMRHKGIGAFWMRS
jgi:hypothetical protein